MRRARTLTGRQLSTLAGLALLAGGLVLLATRDGVSVSGDSSVYVGVAHSVADGHGLNVPIHYYPLGNVSIGTPPAGSSSPLPTPLVVYAPLEPVLLAVGNHPIGAARVEDTIFLALTVLVVGLFVLVVTGELWLAAVAQLIVAFSLAGIDAVNGVSTETTALFFTVVALVAIIRQRVRGGTLWLVVGSLAIGAATVEWFAAGGLIVWGVLALRHRWRQALALLVMSSMPLVVWIVYEQVSGRSTGHALGFHIVKTTVRAGIHSVAWWILPTNSPTSVVVLGAIVIAVLVVLVLRRRPGAVPSLLILFAVVQIVVLEVAITFFDAGVNLEPRQLIPVFVAVVLAVACGVDRTRLMKVLSVVLVVGCVVRFGLDNAANPTSDYTTARWAHSPIMADIRALPNNAIIYSDVPDVIYLLDHRATSSVPETVDFSTLKTNTRFHAQIEEIRHTLLTRGGYVAYVRGLGRDSFLPTEASLRSLLSLQLVRNTSDGAIYRIAGEPATDGRYGVASSNSARAAS